jgi:hypothetical protein
MVSRIKKKQRRLLKFKNLINLMSQIRKDLLKRLQVKKNLQLNRHKVRIYKVNNLLYC